MQGKVRLEKMSKWGHYTIPNIYFSLDITLNNQMFLIFFTSPQYALIMEKYTPLLKMKLLNIKIGYPTLFVKIEIMSGGKKMAKVNTMRVCPNTGATADLISGQLAHSLGCKIR